MSEELFDQVAAELDVFEPVPDEELADAVRRSGSCGWLNTSGDMPEWTGDDRADRELAAPICAACPVRRECLEWEFRTHGYAQAGVWGALAEDDRRAVFLRWLDRRDGTANGGRP
ncbi:MULTISPECIES: WhiB family transcriptional regulator [unclassified Crossiella]|uniref:WhiB family transcriptional regulator n=1 Tax=unclassified Crossiella TaxID=2620835 RepID=UPI001FFE9513|nr:MULTISPECIES: WhiB family transcriptional regulator [unclassified Crossiella]MCK2240188.1 WhiB family transcriptional regulator [Crossiella sp. S99.2]MCK2253360.1 WhiB family transcriptional regulator [Crossiella sp. S99.1]